MITGGHIRGEIISPVSFQGWSWSLYDLFESLVMTLTHTWGCGWFCSGVFISLLCCKVRVKRCWQVSKNISSPSFSYSFVNLLCGLLLLMFWMKQLILKVSHIYCYHMWADGEGIIRAICSKCSMYSTSWLSHENPYFSHKSTTNTITMTTEQLHLLRNASRCD